MTTGASLEFQSKPAAQLWPFPGGSLESGHFHSHGEEGARWRLCWGLLRTAQAVDEGGTGRRLLLTLCICSPYKQSLIFHPNTPPNPRHDLQGISADARLYLHNHNGSDNRIVFYSRYDAREVAGSHSTGFDSGKDQSCSTLAMTSNGSGVGDRIAVCISSGHEHVVIFLESERKCLIVVGSAAA